MIIWGCDLYTECTKIEMHTGIIITRGQNWNTYLTLRGAAIDMWMSYTARFQLKLVVTLKHGALKQRYPVDISHFHRQTDAVASFAHKRAII